MSIANPPLARPRTRARRRINRTNLVRRGVQLFFAGFIIVASLRHQLAGETSALGSIDALCPMGGLETLWTWISTGRFVSKTHPSNLVLGLGLALFHGLILA